MGSRAAGLARGGFTEQELYATGLAQRSQENGRLYDRFRSRIMFPLADIRGRVLGFGARAMQRGAAPEVPEQRRQRPSTTRACTSTARTSRARTPRKAGQVILCEGYTDVDRAAPGRHAQRGRADGHGADGEQVGELARMAPTVLLALDADSAGQEAMLRAAGLAARRKLELRVVPLPAGTDPAELVQRAGAGGDARAAVQASVPFVRFRVERVLGGRRLRQPEGRDRMIDELRPVFATLPPSAMRMELTRIVSERLRAARELSPSALSPRAARVRQAIRSAAGDGGRRARTPRLGRLAR